ncbi:hypothetical protein [Vibrio mediterranei]|uniref:hypothetical protein n=1 Tax=Vibrio mediterranei TaxID=689 RepID=UPI00148BCBD9|nr:hypothetical protein [Vibrio mediterranei]NOI22222.1 hypothetical protein [Vibrio mediterranei]
MKFDSKKSFVAIFIVVFVILFMYFKQDFSQNKKSESNKDTIIAPNEPEEVAFRLLKNKNKGDVIDVKDVELVSKIKNVPEQYRMNVDNSLFDRIEKGSIVNKTLNKGDYVTDLDTVLFSDRDYLRYVIKPGNEGFIVKSGLIHLPIQQFYVGQDVDILAITSSNTNLANEHSITDGVDLNSLDDVKVRRIIKGVKIVSITNNNSNTNGDVQNDGLINDKQLILNVTSSQFSKLLIAQKVSGLEVVPSTAENEEERIESVIDNYKDVTELRG